MTSTMEEEFQDFDNRNAWNSVYQEIRNESNNFCYTFKEAKKTENKNLNRYRDVNPFDHSRVRLQRGGKDYINASLVEVPSADRSYILTQGPLLATTGHFWLMIWEQESKAILMLNRVIEKNAVKCHQYWPLGAENGGEDEMILNEVGLMVTYERSTIECNYVVREFSLTDFQSGKSRTVLQFHYTTWPDFGVPESPAAFLSFLMAVRKSGALNNDVGPAVVHCSAGIGRSGTFCLVDSCLVLIERKGDIKAINIRELLLEMRRYRMGLIQTPDQLRFSYMAIIEGSKALLKNKTDNNVVPSKENIVQDEPVTNNNEEEKEESDSQSEGSNDEVATSTCNSTPPPLPPRPVRIYDVSPSSCNSITESSPLSTLPNNSISPQTFSDQNQNEHSGTIDEKVNNYGEEITESGDINQKTDLVNSTSADSINEQESPAELRKRKRKERAEKTAAIVQKIKKKQKETELWQKRRSLFKRISVGLVILFGTGVLVYRYYSKG